MKTTIKRKRNESVDQKLFGFPPLGDRIGSVDHLLRFFVFNNGANFNSFPHSSSFIYAKHSLIESDITFERFLLTVRIDRTHRQFDREARHSKAQEKKEPCDLRNYIHN